MDRDETLIEQRISGVKARPAGRSEGNRQRRFDHAPRLGAPAKSYKTTVANAESGLTGLLSTDNPISTASFQPVGARYGALAKVIEAPQDSSHVVPLTRKPHRPRQSWTGVIAGKRRYSLLAVAAAAVAVGTAGLTSASPGDGLPAIEAALAGSTRTLDENTASVEVLSVAPPPQTAFTEWVLEKAARFDDVRALEQAKATRPLFTPFTSGVFTSGYGMRWGAMHGGVDIANAIGTPINAVGDGEVIKSGDYNDGYGNSVRIRHTDGTETLYGHMTSTSVAVGQKVLAGDLIGLMGRTGYSTGSHVHFEVWLNGTDRVDPVGWLASRGISVGAID
jgi:murein DD-endopeptidase MepM/ murein hydrolase activator NlpD